MRSYTVAPLAQVVCVVAFSNFDVSLTLFNVWFRLELWGIPSLGQPTIMLR